MNAQVWTGVFLVSAAVGGGFLAFWQHDQIAQLRDQTAALTIAARTARPAGSTTSTPSPPGAAADGTLTEAERLELLRLRGEATRLRERIRGLSELRTENEKLRAQFNATTQAGGGAGLPSGYVRRREAQFAGYGSPEATLQSLLWAIEHQDTNTLFAAFDPEHSAGMYEAFTREGVAEFWKETRVIAGCRILTADRVADDEMSLKVELVPGDSPQDMRFKRLGNEWKLRH